MSVIDILCARCAVGADCACCQQADGLINVGTCLPTERYGCIDKVPALPLDSKVCSGTGLGSYRPLSTGNSRVARSEASPSGTLGRMGNPLSIDSGIVRRGTYVVLSPRLLWA